MVGVVAGVTAGAGLVVTVEPDGDEERCWTVAPFGAGEDAGWVVVGVTVGTVVGVGVLMSAEAPRKTSPETTTLPATAKTAFVADEP